MAPLCSAGSPRHTSLPRWRPGDLPGLSSPPQNLACSLFSLNTRLEVNNSPRKGKPYFSQWPHLRGVEWGVHGWFSEELRDPVRWNLALQVLSSLGCEMQLGEPPCKETLHFLLIYATNRGFGGFLSSFPFVSCITGNKQKKNPGSPEYNLLGKYCNWRTAG